MRARAALCFVTTSLVGCSSCSSGTSPGGTTPSAEQAERPAPPADYEVHEWGLLRGQRDGSADVLRVGAVAPARRVDVMAVDKPVLYFHSADPRTLAEVAVHVEGGTILETWPFVAGSTDVAWRNVALGSQAACTPSPLPTASVPPCSVLGPGAFCESAGLAIVRTDDASCVTTGGSSDRFLFYRAQSHTFEPPLRFSRTQVFEDVSVTNDGDDPIPGVLVRIWSDGIRTRTLVAEPPAPHETIVIGHDFPSDRMDDDMPVDRPVDGRFATDESMPSPSVTGPGREGLSRTMREIGLTSAEVGAFLRAWEPTFFGGDAAHAGATDQPVLDMLSVDGEPAPRDSIVYFLPEPATERVARLSFDPPPRAVHRALAIWTAIRASGEGR
jgi:hypothetical protein